MADDFNLPFPIVWDMWETFRDLALVLNHEADFVEHLYAVRQIDGMSWSKKETAMLRRSGRDRLLILRRDLDLLSGPPSV